MLKRRIAAIAGAAGGLALTGGLVFTPSAEAELVCTKCLMKTVDQGLEIMPDPTRQGVIDDTGDLLVEVGGTVDQVQDDYLEWTVVIDPGQPSDGIAEPEISLLGGLQSGRL